MTILLYEIECDLKDGDRRRRDDSNIETKINRIKLLFKTGKESISRVVSNGLDDRSNTKES